MKVNNPIINKEELLNLFNEKLSKSKLKISNDFRSQFGIYYIGMESTQQLIKRISNISTLHKMKNYLINYK